MPVDRRFDAEWLAIERLDGAERVRAIRGAASSSLVAALSARAENSALRNAIATELLNRQGRAPFLGASIASVSFVIAMILLDWIDTRTLFVLEGGPHAYFMEVLMLAVAAFSLVAYLLWRGRFRNLAGLFRRAKGRNY